MSLGDDIRVCLLFYSRLPAPMDEPTHVMPDFARASWAAPVAGAIIGAIAGSVGSILSMLHLPAAVVGVVCVAVLALTTGALHEDGLADLADGFGGGVAREEKLAIMRDSRLGTYGALALGLSTLLRVAALTALLTKGAFVAALGIVAASALSRAVGLLPLATLMPARHEGAGASASRPSPATMRLALIVGVSLALAPTLAGTSLAQTVVSILAGFAGALAVTRLASRQIGGYTGDVLGAAQQAAEIGVLVALSA